MKQYTFKCYQGEVLVTSITVKASNYWAGKYKAILLEPGYSDYVLDDLQERCELNLFNIANS